MYINESIFDDEDFNIDNQEQETINNINNSSYYKYFPKNEDELVEIITKCIKERGLNCDLNDIDTSKIKNMYLLFMFEPLSKFNGDISMWNVSNVTNMSLMFFTSEFNGDISMWNVSNVKKMPAMFLNSKFNNDISNWNVINVLDMREMFKESSFMQDISKWKINKKCKISGMFYLCPLANISKYLPKCLINESIFDDEDFEEYDNIDIPETNMKSLNLNTRYIILDEIVELSIAECVDKFSSFKIVWEEDKNVLDLYNGYYMSMSKNIKFMKPSTPDLSVLFKSNENNIDTITLFTPYLGRDDYMVETNVYQVAIELYNTFKITIDTVHYDVKKITTFKLTYNAGKRTTITYNHLSILPTITLKDRKIKSVSAEVYKGMFDSYETMYSFFDYIFDTYKDEIIILDYLYLKTSEGRDNIFGIRANDKEAKHLYYDFPKIANDFLIHMRKYKKEG